MPAKDFITPILLCSQSSDVVIETWRYVHTQYCISSECAWLQGTEDMPNSGFWAGKSCWGGLRRPQGPRVFSLFCYSIFRLVFFCPHGHKIAAAPPMLYPWFRAGEKKDEGKSEEKGKEKIAQKPLANVSLVGSVSHLQLQGILASQDCLFIFTFIFIFWPCPWHVEIPRPGIKSSPQRQPEPL